MGCGRFHWTVALLSGWMMAGASIDAWAHRTRPGPETFFTPWHGVLYSGFLAVGGFLLWHAVRGRPEGTTRARLPDGYLPSLWGAGIFLAGGVGDMLWHTLFGIEESLEALVSPSHLTLGVGAGLIVSGPLRAAWHSGRAGFPAVLSTTWLLSVLTFFTQYGHPFVEVLASRPQPDDGSIFSVAGVLGILLQTIFLVGLVSVLLTRLSLPPGAMTVMLVANGLLLAVLEERWSMLVVAVVAGACGDGLLSALRPSTLRPAALRAFCPALAVVWPGAYFVWLLLTTGTGWTVPLWVGTVATAGLLGWLVGLAVLPPRPGGPAPATPSERAEAAAR